MVIINWNSHPEQINQSEPIPQFKEAIISIVKRQQTSKTKQVLITWAHIILFIWLHHGVLAGPSSRIMIVIALSQYFNSVHSCMRISTCTIRCNFILKKSNLGRGYADWYGNILSKLHTLSLTHCHILNKMHWIAPHEKEWHPILNR